MKRIRVLVHTEPEGLWGTSPEVPGWSVAADNLRTLRGRAREGVAFALDIDEADVRLQLVMAHEASYGIVVDTRTTTSGGSVVQDVSSAWAADLSSTHLELV